MASLGSTRDGNFPIGVPIFFLELTFTRIEDLKHGISLCGLLMPTRKILTQYCLSSYKQQALARNLLEEV